MSDIAKIIGQRIRNYRTQKGLSQEKLAELAGCHPTYIGQLERGEKTPRWKAWRKLCPPWVFPFLSYLTSWAKAE